MQGSTPAQVIIAVVPIVGITMGCVVIFFYILWAHREKMTMIKMGVYVPPAFDLSTFSLLTGILLTMVGGVLSIFFVTVGGTKLALLGGLIPLAVGAGLLVYYRIAGRSRG